MGSHRVGQDWSDLAAAAATISKTHGINFTIIRKQYTGSKGKTIYKGHKTKWLSKLKNKRTGSARSYCISTENDIQYPMINYNGKEYKTRIYMCV